MTCYRSAGTAQSVKGFTTSWMFWGSNSSGGEIFHTPPDRPWGSPNHLYNGYRVSFPGVKQLGHGVDHPPPFSAEVKERVELYLYSPSGPSWPALGLTLLYFTLLMTCYGAVHASSTPHSDVNAKKQT
jgi:hypothetical protein